MAFGAELAVAKTFTFSFLGFLISRLPFRLFPFGILYFPPLWIRWIFAVKRIHIFSNNLVLIADGLQPLVASFKAKLA